MLIRCFSKLREKPAKTLYLCKLRTLILFRKFRMVDVLDPARRIKPNRLQAATRRRAYPNLFPRGRDHYPAYPFQPILAWLGTVLFAAALWLFYRVHKELGRNWSDSLEVREQHALVTDGLYRHVRHPMYSAFFMWAVAQALLLPNWFAGPAGVVGFGTLFFCRIGSEERMMAEIFGDEYRRYAARTSRIIPGIF